jgi:excisionase family DNA binding protein
LTEISGMVPPKYPIHQLEEKFKGWVLEAISENNKFQDVKPVTIIDTDQLIEKLGVTRPTIQRWRDQGRIPYIQVGQVIRYDLDKVIEALENKKRRQK